MPSRCGEQYRTVEDSNLKDEAARTTPIGLFHYANSYWMSARVLNANRPKVTHPDEPVNFLFYQAVELFLKAFLRLHGHSARELASRKFGHNFNALGERAEALGLFLMDEDHEVLHLMGTTDAVIRSRYIKTGSFRRPTHGALDRTCKSLWESVGSELKKQGFPVRGLG
jgi:hypothetical protein